VYRLYDAAFCIVLERNVTIALDILEQLARYCSDHYQDYIQTGHQSVQEQLWYITRGIQRSSRVVVITSHQKNEGGRHSASSRGLLSMNKYRSRKSLSISNTSVQEAVGGVEAFAFKSLRRLRQLVQLHRPATRPVKAVAT